MKFASGLIASAMVVTCCWSRPALADETTHDKAVAAFQEGRRYIEGGNCDAAVTKLRESLSYEPSVGARMSLAECYEKNDPLAAWRMLKDAANLAYLNHDDRLTIAEQKAAALEKRLPMIRVAIPASSLELAGFELRIDGELVDKFHYRSGLVAVKPGKHVVEANAPLRHWSEQISATDGGTTSVNVKLERETFGTTTSPAAPVAATTLPRSQEAPGSGRRTLGLALGGVGLAGLASGVAFGIITLSKKSTIEELCGGNTGSCRAAPGSVDPERESASTTAAISTVSFIVGGLALVGGGILYFSAPSATTIGRIRVAPRVGHTGGTVGLEGSF